MKSTFVTTTAVGVGYAACNHSILPDKTIDKKKRNELIASSAISTVTTIAANTVNENINERSHEKYSSAYVESMTDEELVNALERIGELSGEDEVSLENAKSK